MKGIEYIKCDSTHEYFVALIELLDAELVQLYGEAQAAYQPHNAIGESAAVVAVEGEMPVGCGCYRPFDRNNVEIKRMYVKPDYRGRGIAGQLLSQLEAYALKAGYKAAVLETGYKQKEAIGLYEKCGYKRILNYGPYVEMKSSICFKKHLL